ncbi:endonuclease [Streptomyces sp. TR06-5]|uniref:endonuclease n=1 Tax=Streptomyces sp. TR06-5 TaxID=3385976 RepID=UPI00399F9303
MTTGNDRLVREVLRSHGRTYAAEAGISLRNTPAPLFQLLVLCLLLSARIRASVAVASARALFDAGLQDAASMAGATWQQRVDALGEGGYRRYDERTSTQLGRAAALVLDRYGGDLRRLRGAEDVGRLLQEVPGIGPTGSRIFLREVQALWPEEAPRFDGKAREGAARIGLPTSAEELERLVPRKDLPRLAAALVRVALDPHAGEEVANAA